MAPDRRLPELFAEILELSADARAARLTELRRQEPLLAREIEELLAAATAGERRFSDPLVPPARPVSGGTPERVGPYRIVRELGRGGMGRVFLAEQEEADFHRSLALKVVDRPGFAEENLRRFRDEVRILASLEHSGIARFLDGGRTADGTWFLALEYIEGEDLVSYVRRTGLDLRQRVELFLQVLDAVDFAHRRLIVHRDLKPGNVLVGADGRTKLLDFGISKILDPDSTDEAATRTELRALTPAYASPEQLRGERATIASDVYSLGVMLYELLSGRRPFAQRGAAAEALDREPAPPSTAARQGAPTRQGSEAATQVRWRDLSGDLDAITLKALRAEPDNRYGSAVAMADDLRRWLEGRPVEARRGGRRYRFTKFIRRHRLPVGFAALALVALVGGTVIALVQARSSARERDRALEDLRRAEITNDMSSFLISVAAPAGASKVDALASAEAMVHRRFAGDPELRVHLLLALAERYDENYHVEAWQRTAEQAYVLSRPVEEPRLRALAACALAGVKGNDGDVEAARRLLEEAFADLATAPGAAAEEARCRNAEARAAFFGGDAEAAIRAAERELALERGRRGPPGRELHALSALANSYSSAGRYSDADRTFAELMRGFSEQGREHTAGAVINAVSWANSAHSAGQLLHAVTLHERAVALARAVYPDQGVQPATLTSFARALASVGRLDEALAIVDEAVIQAGKHEERWPQPYALRTAASLAIKAGKLELAEQRLAALRDLVQKSEKPSWSDLMALDQVGAQLALARGDASQAVALARSALRRAEEAKRPASSSMATLDVLAMSLNASGDHAEALEIAQRRATYSESILGGFQHSHALGLAMLEAGVAQAGLGDGAAAVLSLDTAIEHLRATVGEAAPDTRRALEARSRLHGPAG